MSIRFIQLIFSLVLLHSQLWAEPAESINWQEYGIMLLNRDGNTKQTTLLLRDAENREFELTYPAEVELSATRWESIQIQLKSIYTWQFLEVRRLHVLIAESGHEIHLVPSRVTCDGREVVENIPGGLFFYQREALEYNLRLNYNKYFIRISGIFLDGRALCKKITDAIQEPTLYIEDEKNSQSDQKLLELEKRVELAMLENRRTKYAMAALHNRGFWGCLGGPRPLEQRLIERIIEIKSKKPFVKSDELQSILESDGYKVSRDELLLILGVYYNEFEK